MIKKKILDISIFIAFALLNSDCKDLGETPDYLKPGRRDYIWTVDTLDIPGGDRMYPSRIWGSAPNDVWLVCTGSVRDLIWHFDGIHWQRDTLPRPIYPSALWGFTCTNVWMGNLGAGFWRFNGVQWYKHSEYPSVPGFDAVGINSIWGKNDCDMYAAGFAYRQGDSDHQGVILRFVENGWHRMTIPVTRSAFSEVRQQRDSNLLFLEGYEITDSGFVSTVHVWDETANQLAKIYSSRYAVKVEEVDGKVFFVTRQRIYVYRQGNLSLWKDFSQTEYFGRMVGRSELDFFGQGTNGNIVHYNGTDIAVLYANTMDVWAAFVVGNSAFFVCEDLEHDITAVIKGTLK